VCHSWPREKKGAWRCRHMSITELLPCGTVRPFFDFRQPHSAWFTYNHYTITLYVEQCSLFDVSCGKGIVIWVLIATEYRPAYLRTVDKLPLGMRILSSCQIPILIRWRRENCLNSIKKFSFSILQASWDIWGSQSGDYNNGFPGYNAEQTDRYLRTFQSSRLPSSSA
jgi:hypothetical protein